MEKGTRLGIEMNVLILDPFHIGSHAHWSKGMHHFISKLEDASCDLWTLPGRHWKWRMHGACGAFANKASEQMNVPDVIVTTDMLDVAGLRGLLPMRWRKVPIVLYFHENQLTFPWSPDDKERARGLHHTYEFINIQSAVAADWVWFNSTYHRDVFCKAADEFIRKMPDERSMYSTESLKAKSSILPVGIAETTKPIRWRPISSAPVVLWNHRWEYDKGPDRFFQLLCELEHAGCNFQLNMCGARYKDVHPALTQIKERFAGQILHNGFTESHSEYKALLQQSDFIVHEPVQEYFGVSVAEAMAHGVIPLVKDDQAYTSWMPEQFRFSDTNALIQKWTHFSTESTDARNKAYETVEPFFWPYVVREASAQMRRLVDGDIGQD